MAGPAFRAAPVRVRVPATSANLGPAFDSAGLALARYDDVYLQVTDEGLDVDVAGEGAGTVRRDRRNLVVVAMHTAFDALGGRPRGLSVRCVNRIPHGRGLGSSAAAIVAGLVAARAVTVGGGERLDDDGLLGLAAAMEGHPDNVAAAIHGGLTLAWTGADGRPAALRLEPAAALVPVVLVPAAALSTAKARRLLPASVPHADAAHAAGRAALLAEAVTRRPDLLLAATEDRLHQGYRGPAMPRSQALVDALRAEGLAAVVSGAGPSVLVLTDAEDGRRLAETPRRGWQVDVLEVDRHGAEVLPVT